jgi:cyclohexadienyl dehydratase
MKNLSTVIIAALVGVIAAYATVTIKAPEGSTPTGFQKEAAYERVLRTGILRCAYAAIQPDSYKDLKTGEMKGPIIDIAEKMADQLNLTIEWVSEVGFADFAEGLNTGRYDAFCGVIGKSPGRARAALFTTPTLYYPSYIYVRKNDDRFTSFEDLNKPSIKAGAIDGELTQFMTKKYFPNAKEMSLSNMSSPAELFLNLANGKIDFVIHTATNGNKFIANNPDKIEPVFSQPIEVRPAAFAVNVEENKLAALLNTSIETLVDLGVVENIIKAHDLEHDLLPRAKSYQLTMQQ